jgi:hypothetical protein
MTACVEWTGYRNSKGYGLTWVREENCQRLAHRVLWERERGPIPEGMVIMHTCDNPPCVNLEHLRLGTQAENLADMKAKGRSQKWVDHYDRCVNGHPFDEANTRHGIRDGYATRHCRACARENTRRHRAR